jgi:hypothetical protein
MNHNLSLLLFIIDNFLTGIPFKQVEVQEVHSKTIFYADHSSKIEFFSNVTPEHGLLLGQAAVSICFQLSPF